MAKAFRIAVCAVAVVEFVAVVATGAYLGFREKPAGHSDPGAVAESHQVVAAGSGQADEPIVCTTRGNRYYHRRSCRYVRASKIAMPLSRAQLHRRPCSRCKPAR